MQLFTIILGLLFYYLSLCFKHSIKLIFVFNLENENLI